MASSCHFNLLLPPPPPQPVQDQANTDCLLQPQVVNLTQGSKIWVEDDDSAWVPAEVLEVQTQHVKAKIAKQKRTVVVSISSIYPRDADALPRGEDDMTKLAYLHEPGVLYNLRSRYELNEIYTYTGKILIAVNPFVRLPHLYDSHMMQQYKGAVFGELNPHVFAISDSAYRAMISRNQNQAILVSGESGAGKTETTKLIMQYLAFVGGRTANDGRTVEQQVLESNPLLEAFGNAKTVRNDNSSRFGKFVEIQFNSVGKISGAAIRTYLLERSRLVQLNDQERNYHCFYQLCASNIDANRYKLLDPTQFHYLNQSNCFVLRGVDDGLEYSRTRRAMDIVGINPIEQDAIFRTLAAILHLGNIQFKPGTEHDSSILKDEQSYFHLQTAAELLMCDVDNLNDTLCTRIILTHGEVIKKMLDPEAALTNRNTFSKTIYVHLFDWLVDKINKSIGQDKESQVQIGLLDIYGFESFPNNSFEQFCINLANEKLQQHFNEHALRMEQEEYNNEGIDWSYIKYIDNQDVLELIEKRPMGIIALLDEACMFPKSTNETFATKLFHAFKNNERFRKPKLSTTDFIISHYAGEVLYQTDFFLEKNKDFVIVEHQALLESSRDPFVSGLFTSRADYHMKPSYKFSSVATRFKQQLQLLMETLSSSEPHYIRCVKPNNDNKAGKFENRSVLHQLRCSGVLEAVRISCAGYPTRTTYDEFLNRFGFLASNIVSGCADKKVATENFLQHLNITDYQLGVTKVFLRTGQMAELETRRSKVLSKAIKIIEHKTYAYLLRKRFLMIRRSALCIQSHWRGYVARIVYKTMCKEAATIFIQSVVRMWLAKKSFLSLRKATIRIQKHVRIFLAQKHQPNNTTSSDYLKIQVKIGQSKVEEIPNIEHTPLETGNTKQEESTKGSEVATLQTALAEMEKSKTNELQRLRTALDEVEKSKTAELERLEFALREMEESKNAHIRKLQATVLEKEASKTTELAMLQRKLQHIKETKSAELSRLQMALLQNEEKKRTELTRMQNAVHQIEGTKQAESARLVMLNEQTQEFVEEKMKGLQNAIIELEKSKQAELARIEATLAEIKMSRGAELEQLQNALIEMEELKGTEIIRLQNTLLGMEESKKTDLAKLQAAVLQMEESKRTEMTRLQTAILQIKETKSIELASVESALLQIRETHKVQLMESEKVHNEELTRLQNMVLEMKRLKQAELANMRASLIEMEESKGAELARLQKKLNKIEESKKTELSKLRNALTELEESKRKDLQRLQATVHEIEESKREEVGRLKATLLQIEETKSAELARLQNMLLEMQQQLETMRILILNERETNKMLSIQLASLLKIRPLLEASEAKAYQLAKENGHLRILNDIHENKVLEAEKELVKARKDGDEIFQKNKEAELKIEKVRETLQRLEEKMTFLEVENEVLRTQANTFSPSGQKDHVTVDKGTENSHKLDSESTGTAEQLVIKISPMAKNYQQDITPGRRSITFDDRKLLFASPTQENQDILVDWIVQDLGFSDEKPIAACTIYTCLLQWNTFQSERTNIFDRLAQAIGACIEAQESNDILAYWLSNISTLLRIGHQNMKPKEVPNTPSTPNTPRRLGLFGKITKSFRSPSLFKRPHVKRGLSSLDSLCQLEVKTPAVAFKQQLTVFIEKLYGLLRDNLKKEISPILTACIQAPRTSRAKGQQLGPFNAASFTHNLTTTHWSRITESLNEVFLKLHTNHVPPFFVCKIFTQTFSFINAQLFNSLLLRRECCSFTNGEYLKAGLSELETWLFEIPQQYAGDSWEELKLIRQAVAFLVIHQKSQRSYDEIRQDLCPNLSVQQLYRISTMYWDDKYGTHSVSQEVIYCMKKCMSEETNKSSGSSFLLDDDSSIPFSLEEMLVSMPDIDPTAVQYPPTFQFDLQDEMTPPPR